MEYLIKYTESPSPHSNYPAALRLTPAKQCTKTRAPSQRCRLMKASTGAECKAKSIGGGDAADPNLAKFIAEVDVPVVPENPPKVEAALACENKFTRERAELTQMVEHQRTNSVKSRPSWRRRRTRSARPRLFKWTSSTESWPGPVTSRPQR